MRTSKKPLPPAAKIPIDQNMLPRLRRLALAKQGLNNRQHFGTGIAGTLNAIAHLGYVQIDTLSVVERAHHHILWSRVPHYQAAHLNQLVRDKKIFEYWHHAASYLPMRDYRYALLHMESVRRGHHKQFSSVDKQLTNQILARVKAEGPLRLRDLDTTTKGQGTWWNYDPGRRAVEKLFMQGDLMVCERNGMEKVYDLSERCLPTGIDLTVPTIKEYAIHLLAGTLRAHGVFTWKQLLHLKTGKPLRDAMRQVLDEHIEAGQILELTVAGGHSCYADATALEQAPKADHTVKVLSPFDNLVIHRDRLNVLFGFDYRIECYVPASKRVFGYFCLPILFGDRLVGRIDCKAHRAEQRLQIVSLHLEPGEFNNEQFYAALMSEMQSFAHFNKCSRLDDGSIQSKQH